MNTFSDSLLKQAQTHSTSHHEEITNSKVCGCFYCETTFSSTEIQKWTDEESSAICPKCGIDAVIGDSSKYPVGNKEFLAQMHKYWF